jgi:hypothetical protein
MDKNALEEIKKAKETGKHVQAHDKLKRKSGRKPMKVKFDKRVVTYFLPEQVEIINEYCDLLNISVNEFIRNTVMEKLNKQDSEKEIDVFIDGIDSKELGDVIKDFLKD